MIGMTEYEKLVFAEKHALITDFMANIEARGTGETGVAYTLLNGKVAVFYGADDGSDDKTVTADEFNRDFKVIGD